MLHKKMEKHKYNNDKTNYTKKTTDETAEEILKIEKIEAKKYIRQLGSLLFKTKTGLLNACYYTDYPKQCSDGSTLFTMVKINGENTLIKVGAGEFNTEVFNQEDINKNQKYVDKYKTIKGLGQTPIPLFVVGQTDSFFMNEEQKSEIINNPKDYIHNYGLIAVPKKKQAHLIEKKGVDFNKIHIPTFEKAQKNIKNSIIKVYTQELQTKKLTKKQIETYVKQVFQKFQNLNFENFSKNISKQVWNEDNSRSKVHQQIIYLLENIVPENGNKKQMYDLVKSYNISKEVFE